MNTIERNSRALSNNDMKKKRVKEQQREEAGWRTTSETDLLLNKSFNSFPKAGGVDCGASRESWENDREEGAMV